MAKKKSKKKYTVCVVMQVECLIEVDDLNDCTKEIKALTNELNSIGITVGSVENIEEIA